MKHILWLFLIVFLGSCDQSDLHLDLPRDNPYDANNTLENNGPNEDYFPILQLGSFKIAYDDDKDGIVNKGEKVYLALSIKNSGNFIASNVKLNLKSLNNYASDIFPSSLNYSDIPAGESIEKTYSVAPNNQLYSFRFQTANSTPDNERIGFDLNMVDDIGNEYMDTFFIVVQKIKADLVINNIEIVHDNNVDQIPNKGERLYLRIGIKNIGSSQAVKVKSTLNSNSPYISNIFPGSLNYGDIGPNAIIAGSYTIAPNNQYYSFRIDLSNATPDDEALTLTINMENEFTNEWEDDFEIVVKKTNANIQFNDFEIVYDNKNNNGKAEAGETVFISLKLRNNGSSKATDVILNLNSNESNIVSIIPNSLNYGDIQPFEIKSKHYSTASNNAAYSFSIRINNDATPGEILDFDLIATDDLGNSWEDAFSLTIF